MKHACRYTIVQFLPFAETGEFANIGIALVCPDSGYFGFRLASRGWGRISEFFSPLDRRIYSAAIDRLATELARIEALANCRLPNKDLQDLWNELVRQREGLIQCAPERAAFVEDPAAALGQMFGRYVERNFVTTEYQERRLEQTVRDVLKAEKLTGLFKRRSVGPDYYRIPLPFVREENDCPVQAIKPLYLAHDEPTKILLHGGEWLERLRRLRKHGFLPGGVLIPTGRPRASGLREDAYKEICADFEEDGFRVGDVNDSERIRLFAMGEATIA
ncbi:MAG: DUF3037 domain-containing protein [Aliidongia sp.]